MKKILIMTILLSCSMAAIAIPGPQKKNQKKARVTIKTKSHPLPPKVRR